MARDQFLYEELNGFVQMGGVLPDVSDSIARNLNPRYELRPYQTEAFARFLHCENRGYRHLLFNMATGSGKTLIMAGAILYLYEKGFRNFLFFVSKTNIVEKTKDNFLNSASSKHLFAPDIVIGGRRVRVSAVDNFSAVNSRDINIHFTTIQGLHSRLTTVRENAVSLADFAKHKIALISDESHHMNVDTRRQLELREKPSWENTVAKIFGANEENILLEFTATHDYADPDMRAKYLNKVAVRYDLAEFRRDRYSKDVVLVRSDFGVRERILQALILSQYRREAAAKHRIDLKPVLLFKSRTKRESEDVQKDFHAMVDGLTAADIVKIHGSEIPIIRGAFQFFAKNKMDARQLAARLRAEFNPEFCLSANDDKDGERNQILLNSLEDKGNPIRAVFAVQKLTEGWDVLNLFDIVRCHENPGTRNASIAEAQLIGRGARYFPFVIPEDGDRYRRKFDDNAEHELRVLEEMHYHSINDSEYIFEVRRALAASGITDDRDVSRPLELKASFKESRLFKLGTIWLNQRELKNYRHVASFADLGVSRTDYKYDAASGEGGEVSAFGKNRGGKTSGKTARRLQLNAIPRNVVESALARNPFFAFDKLRRFFPQLNSMRDFISSADYLGGLGIVFYGDSSAAESRREQLAAVRGLLARIETGIRAQDAEYAGTAEFTRNAVREVFRNKVLKFSRFNPRGEPDKEFEDFVANSDWCAFNGVGGTSEEKSFVRTMGRKMNELQEQYEEIYLVRNERHFKIFNFADGRPFEPDFALFLRGKNGGARVYQIFIEPKGAFIAEGEKWKNEFLREIRRRFADKILSFGEDDCRIVGLPFFNSNRENKFMDALDAALRGDPAA